MWQPKLSYILQGLLSDEVGHLAGVSLYRLLLIELEMLLPFTKIFLKLHLQMNAEIWLKEEKLLLTCAYKMLGFNFLNQSQ